MKTRNRALSAGRKLVGRGLFLAAAVLPALFCSRARPGFIILCAGDSLTAQGYPQPLRRMIGREAGVAVKVLNRGRSGNTSGEYLRYIRNRTASLAALHPDFILLQLGTNDVRIDADRTSVADFEKNMRGIIGILRGFRSRADRPPVIFLGLIPPVPEGAGFPFSRESGRRVREEINPALLRLAAELGTPLVDNYSLYVSRPDLLPDVHPNREGYRELARNWFRALAPRLRASR
jgi:lysophospholipase L1-like esterase